MTFRGVGGSRISIGIKPSFDLTHVLNRLIQAAQYIFKVRGQAGPLPRKVRGPPAFLGALAVADPGF